MNILRDRSGAADLHQRHREIYDLLRQDVRLFPTHPPTHPPHTHTRTRAVDMPTEANPALPLTGTLASPADTAYQSQCQCMHPHIVHLHRDHIGMSTWHTMAVLIRVALCTQEQQHSTKAVLWANGHLKGATTTHYGLQATPYRVGSPTLMDNPQPLVDPATIKAAAAAAQSPFGKADVQAGNTIRAERHAGNPFSRGSWTPAKEAARWLVGNLHPATFTAEQSSESDYMHSIVSQVPFGLCS